MGPTRLRWRSKPRTALQRRRRRRRSLPTLGGRHLSQVGGHHHRGDADAQPHNHAPHHQPPAQRSTARRGMRVGGWELQGQDKQAAARFGRSAGRLTERCREQPRAQAQSRHAHGGRHDQRPCDEEEAVQGNGLAAAVAQHGGAAQERAEEGAKLGSAHDRLRRPVADPKGIADVEQRAADQAQVVACKAAAGNGDRFAGGKRRRPAARACANASASAKAHTASSPLLSTHRTGSHRWRRSPPPAPAWFQRVRGAPIRLLPDTDQGARRAAACIALPHPAKLEAVKTYRRLLGCFWLSSKPLHVNSRDRSQFWGDSLPAVLVLPTHLHPRAVTCPLEI